MATIETVPLLFIFVFLMSYTLGAFGIVHTGILNSIAARTYAFETFRNRTNLVYFRDNSAAFFIQYRDTGNRTHGVLSEKRSDGQNTFLATERPIRMGIAGQPITNRNNSQVHNVNVHTIAPGRRNQNIEVNPAWITVQYGICMNPSCGD